MQTMRLFAEVARCHSFSQAASLHGITQSAASQRIGQLEKKLGVTLIDRSVRPLALTEAGRVFQEGCEDVIQRYDKLERRIASMRDEPAGNVRIAAIYSSGIELLERIRHDFEREYPRIGVDIAYDANPEHIHELVLGGEADLGLVSYPERFKKVGVIQLREEVMAVVCAPGHALAGRRSVTAAQLSAHAMLSFDLDLPVGRRIKAYLKEHGGSPRVAHRFDNIDTLKNAVTVTDAFAILPKRTVMREVSAGTLVIVDLAPMLTRPMGALYRVKARNGDALAPPVRAFVEFLVRSAGPEVDVVGSLTDDALTPVGTRQ